MAASGYTPISLYYSATPGNTPVNTNLVNGELAINTADGKLFYKDSNGDVQIIASKGGGGGAPIGAIQYFAGTTSTSYPGASWLKCDGSIASQATYPELYSKIGTLYDGFYNLQNTVLNTTAVESGNTINDIKYFGGQYIAVGSAGYIGTSTNGVSWTQRVSTTSGALYSVTYDGSKYLACGATPLLSSTDGITWTTVTTSGLPAVTGQSNTFYGNILYVSGLTNPYIIGCGNKQDAQNTSNILSSTDAITWTNRTTIPRGVGSLTYANNLVIAAGCGGNPAIRSSTDGVTWSTTTISTLSNIYNCYIQPICYIGGLYIFSSTAGNSAAVTSTSTNLTTWTTVTGNMAGFGASAAIYDGSAVYGYAIGSGYKTTDGVTFTRFGDVSSTAITSSLYYSGNYFYGSSNGVIRKSSAGDNWPIFILQTLATNGSLVVGVGTSGNIGTSTNGTSWTARSSGVYTDLYKVKYLSDNKFWCVGASGVILNSTDGITWSSVTSGTSSGIYDITYNSSTYIAVGVNGIILSSTNGTSWSQSVFGSSNYTDVTYYNSNFFASGVNWAKSTDGITWQAVVSSAGSVSYTAIKDSVLYISTPPYVYKTTDFSKFDVVLNGGAYIIQTVGDYLVLSGTAGLVDNPIIYFSKDGENWSLTPRSSNGSYVACALLGNTIIATGSNVAGTANRYSYSTGSDFALPKEGAQFSPNNATNTAYIKAL